MCEGVKEVATELITVHREVLVDELDQSLEFGHSDIFTPILEQLIHDADKPLVVRGEPLAQLTDLLHQVLLEVLVGGLLQVPQELLHDHLDVLGIGHLEQQVECLALEGLVT